MTTYRDELKWAYNGEVYGVAMFATMADLVEDPERSAQLRLCAELERQTMQQLAVLCDRERIVRDDGPWEARGRKAGERAGRKGWDWERFLRSFDTITTEALPRYHHIRDVLARPGDGDTMVALVTHEDALQRFADDSLAGEATAAGHLLSTLTGPHRAGAEADLAPTHTGTTAGPYRVVRT